jgi:urease accessory protein
MSAHAATVGFLGAAVRLAIVGHLDAQRILTKAHAIIEETVSARPTSELDQLSSYAPAAEIAAMRHETRDARLFFN